MLQANPINITRIDHVVIRVHDMQRMVAFYRDALGCKLERGPGELGLAQLRAGDSLIDLVDAEGPLGREGGEPPARGAHNMDHVCFMLCPWDAEAVVSHLAEQGIEAGAVESRYGATGQGPSIYLKDPEGNGVELKGQ